jgi:hypothetical protein
MSTSATPETAPKYDLNNPPPGFKWDWDEVKGDHGQLSFGQRPLLTVEESKDGADALIEFYGAEGVARIYNGTSGRVQHQGIARRVTQKGKKEGWDDDKINATIAEEQLKYRPGKRAAGQSTAQSRAANAAKKAAGKIHGDAIAAMIERVASLPEAERLAMAQQLGIDPALFQQPTSNGAETEPETDEQEQNGEGEQQDQ